MIRQEIGDEVRISGTATGGSKTTLVDTAALTQADDYWNGRRIYITSTTDGLAPQGESRKVADFVSSTKTATLEMALSAAAEAGDTYQIAIWPDAVYNALISAAIAAYSKYRPYRSTGTLAMVAGTRYYNPPAGVDLRAGHRIEEIRYINQTTQEDYPITGWTPDRHQNKIDLGYFASESKTLTVFYVSPHVDFTGDTGTITVPDQDEELIVKYVVAQFYLLMARENFDDFGNLVPARWTRGNVSEEAGSSHKNMKDLYDSLMADWREALNEAGAIISTPKIAEPGEWVAPHDYRGF
ncbi:MAG TPA: hypothetical protein PKZ83_17195 [bacterium]|nr:hypothetical protein [bacterium]